MLREISAKRDPPSEVLLQLPREANLEIKVEYEWLPQRCQKCCSFGHGDALCPTKTRWVEKEVKEMSFSIYPIGLEGVGTDPVPILEGCSGAVGEEVSELEGCSLVEGKRVPIPEACTAVSATSTLIVDGASGGLVEEVLVLDGELAPGRTKVQESGHEGLDLASELDPERKRQPVGGFSFGDEPGKGGEEIGGVDRVVIPEEGTAASGEPQRMTMDNPAWLSLVATTKTTTAGKKSKSVTKGDSARTLRSRGSH